jgi:hypothetical protein
MCRGRRPELRSNCLQHHWFPSCHYGSDEKLGICSWRCSLTGLNNLGHVPHRILGPVHHRGKLAVGVNVVVHWRPVVELTMVHVVIETMMP